MPSGSHGWDDWHIVSCKQTHVSSISEDFMKTTMCKQSRYMNGCECVNVCMRVCVSLFRKLAMDYRITAVLLSVRRSGGCQLCSCSPTVSHPLPTRECLWCCLWALESQRFDLGESATGAAAAADMPWTCLLLDTAEEWTESTSGCASPSTKSRGHAVMRSYQGTWELWMCAAY